MPDKKKSLLQYAVEKFGRSELARRMKVSQETLDAWLYGGADMTNSKALALADLIDELTQPLKPLK